MLEITDATFETEVVQSEKPVVLDFTATWCGPCKRLAPIIEEIAKEYEGRVKVAKFDIDQSPETPARFRIMSVPTVLFFKGGKPVDMVVGLTAKENLKKKIEPLLS
jgi:thioredoxin 1